MADRRTSATSSRRTRTGDSAIGQFIIGSEIGKGSFATVYVGKHQVRHPSLLSLSIAPFVPFPRGAAPGAVTSLQPLCSSE